MSFFHKEMSQNFWATNMPFGPVTNLLLAQKKAGPHFRHCLLRVWFRQVYSWFGLDRFSVYSGFGLDRFTQGLV
jgi:hypothetical protein